MILATFLNAIGVILHLLITFYILIVILAALCSFVQANSYNQFVIFLYQVTEPVYMRVRKIIPTNFGGIDIAPLVVVVILKFIDLFVVGVILNYAKSL